ncbi:hypothetical protein HCN44_000118 [Aphidius gifuensis]|uniref:Protein sleepless n=1 Tax=Aphidius gifuensis TaxID=684658 RepID=A0A834XN20_APHGI|nr:uncharacterized protein LOC122855312 [Aphidius gifuensis]KAF7990313.1 hypothetical protein HCN44_000118 [Aphidius gifuensis]
MIINCKNKLNMDLKFSKKILFIFICLNVGFVKGRLSCYECNIDLNEGRRAECNDPYAPGPSVDLVTCPNYEPHSCLKAIILYKNVHVTVRSCVPTRTQNTYCDFHNNYPEASVSCSFCNENACNKSSILLNININLIIIEITFVLYYFFIIVT